MHLLPLCLPCNACNNWWCLCLAVCHHTLVLEVALFCVIHRWVSGVKTAWWPGIKPIFDLHWSTPLRPRENSRPLAPTKPPLSRPAKTSSLSPRQNPRPLAPLKPSPSRPTKNPPSRPYKTPIFSPHQNPRPLTLQCPTTVHLNNSQPRSTQHRSTLPLSLYMPRSTPQRSACGEARNSFIHSSLYPSFFSFVLLHSLLLSFLQLRRKGVINLFVIVY